MRKPSKGSDLGFGWIAFFFCMPKTPAAHVHSTHTPIISSYASAGKANYYYIIVACSSPPKKLHGPQLLSVKKNTILMNADSFLNHSSFITGSCADSQASNSSSVKSIIHQVKKSTVGNLKSRNSQKRGTLNFTDNLSCLEASGWKENEYALGVKRRSKL